MQLPPSEGGRVFYNADITGYNFTRTMMNARAVLNLLLQAEKLDSPPTILMQAMDAGEALPGFEADHSMPLVPDVTPKLWIGNAGTVAPHYDLQENVACVAAGHRRFVLFPPDQLPNLYLGPIENSPAGAPISMVDLSSPDLEKYPRFRTAMAHAQVAELGPGDAIYIPFMWWHGVQALDRFNILVNYWWDDNARPGQVHPLTALMVAQLAFFAMTKEQRSLWRAMFDHYIFTAADHPLAHLPEHARGIFSSLDQRQLEAARRTLARALLD
jgi:hypothetical protein